jgi:DNA primase
MFNRHDIDEMKKRVDILRVALHYRNDYVPSGISFTGDIESQPRISKCRCVCGRRDSNPSLAIYRHEQTFYCFSCQRGGDVIDLISIAEATRRMNNEHRLTPEGNLTEYLKFSEAVAILEEFAKDAQEELILPKETTAKETSVGVRITEDYYAFVLDALADVFHDNISAKRALSYIHERRKISIDALKQFKIGYCPPHFDSNIVAEIYSKLKEYGKSESYSAADIDEILHQIGIIYTKNERNYFMFRDRIVFPVYHAGHVRWMIGRSIDQSNKVKYIGLPNGKAFKIPYVIHGGDAGTIIVEGVMDALAIWQSAFGRQFDIMAMLGLTHRQIDFNSLKKPIYVITDNDAAGISGLEKIAQTMLSNRIMPNCVFILSDMQEIEELERNYGMYYNIIPYVSAKNAKDPADLLLNGEIDNMVKLLYERSSQYKSNISRAFSWIGNWQ